jgi:putative glutamine amidotransferase
VIGVSPSSARATWDSWVDTPATVLPEEYLTAIVEAGAAPVLLFAGSDPEAVIDRLDGLVLVGGPDVDPALYGQVPGSLTQPADRRRDTFESALIALATRRKLPLLGICRGMQLLNVCRGGTLHQHLPDVVGHRCHSPGPGVYGESEIAIAPQSALAQALGATARTVDCYHHQGIDQLGQGLVVVGRSSDGVVEAVEDPSLPFALAVQWHPEVRGDAALFRSFVEACSTRPD